MKQITTRNTEGNKKTIGKGQSVKLKRHIMVRLILKQNWKLAKS